MSSNRLVTLPSVIRVLNPGQSRGPGQDQGPVEGNQTVVALPAAVDVVLL
jgi:hypothetical protein